MANSPFQFPPHRDDDCMDLGLNHPGYEGGGDAQRSFDRHILPQGYGLQEYAPQVFDAGWMIHPFLPNMTQARGMMHARATSELVHATDQGMSEHYDLYNRRNSVPLDAYALQRDPLLQPAQGYYPGGCYPGSQTLQGLPSMALGQYQQPQIQPTMPGLVENRPTPTLTIPSTTGGQFPGPHSASPPLTPWYTPGSSPHPPQHPQLNPDFRFGAPFPHHADQETLTVPGTNYSGGGRGSADRHARSNSRVSPYHDARRASWTWDNAGQMRATGSPIDPVASTSQARLDDSESATSPGAESDLYLSFPDTPAETTGAMSEELDEAALKVKQRKEKQKIKKQAERAEQAVLLDEIKKLLNLKSPTVIETLEKVVEFLDGDVPARKNQPTMVPEGKKRTKRAGQVSSTRADITRLYDVITKCLGNTTRAAPKRGVLLTQIVCEIEKQIAMKQPPAS